MNKILCFIGFHKWTGWMPVARVPGEKHWFKRCTICGKVKTMQET